MSESVMIDGHGLTCAALASKQYLEIQEFGELECTCGGKMFTDLSQSNYAADGVTVSHGFAF